MIVTMRCFRCDRTETLEVYDVFTFAQNVESAGWEVTTAGLSGGFVVSRDYCPDHAMVRPVRLTSDDKEAPHGGAGSPSDPGVGALQAEEIGPARTGPESEEP